MTHLAAAFVTAGLWLNVQAEAPCELQRTLPEALRQAGVEVTVNATHVVSVAPVEGGVTVALSDLSGAPWGWLELPVLKGNCAAVPYAMAAVVEGWLESAGGAVKQPSSAPTLVPAAAVAEQRSEPVEAPPLPGPRRTLALQTSAGLAVDTQPVGQVAVTLGFGFREPWGLALEVMTETPRNQGIIQATLWGGGLWLRRAFLPFEGSQTGVYAGVGARVFALTTKSFVSNHRFDASVAVAAQAEWRQVLYGGLFLSGALVGQARFFDERLTFSSPTGPVTISIAPFAVSAAVGAGWFF